MTPGREQEIPTSINDSFMDVAMNINDRRTRWIYSEHNNFEQNLVNSLALFEFLGYDECDILNGYDMTQDELLVELEDHPHTEMTIIIMPKSNTSCLLSRVFRKLQYQDREQVVFIARYPCLNQVQMPQIRC